MRSRGAPSLQHIGEGAADLLDPLVRPASSPSITPSSETIPARNISAIASMIPEPQTPVTPSRRGRLGEARLVGPEIAADHLELRLERHAVDAHALDRARRRALAAGNLRALEGRAGRRGAGEQPLAIAEHDLGVGADVDQKRQLVLEMRALGEHDARPCRRRHGRRCRAAHRRTRRARRRGRVRARALRKPRRSSSANGAPPSSVGSRPRTR